ncbi:MAG: N-acetylneuraminate synthase family protein [Deltaproteobacteria bacterium]|jgi:N-acetylneuraminate synthase|nr:N-acetylneuraminate synthase family protein [Deltaproteobacteria bacterium]
MSWLADPRPGNSCSVIAEVAQNHDGSLGMAHAFIDAAADAGADVIKFQTHIASAESTLSEPWRKPFSDQDATRLDYWKRMEFSEAQWAGLQEHARKRDLLFISSPFSMEAVDMLTRVGVDAWKVASGEISNPDLLDAMTATGLPILISTGMSPSDEIDAAVARVQKAGAPLAVMQCTSVYPCPPELVGINLIPAFRERYGCAVGLSDHSATIYPGLAAATLGIEVLEVHLTLSREMFGPDVVASITPTEMRQLVDGIRFIERMRANPADKNELPESVTSLRGIFMKSVVARDDLPAGTVLREEHLTTKKPGSGIPAGELPSLVGRRLRRAVDRDTLLSLEDLE